MTIFTQPRIRQGFLEEYVAPLGDALAETAEYSLFGLGGGISPIMRTRELARAERGVAPNFLDINPFGEESPSTVSPMVDATTARSRIQEEGVELTVPDNGIRQRALDILIERKKVERRQNDVWSRMPKGIVPQALNIGTALNAAATDPINAVFK